MQNNLFQKVYISTYGCQMNDNDTERMYSLLEMADYEPVSSAIEADFVILNSCSVREKPVHKIRSEVGLYKDYKKKKPHFKIGVAGCVAQQEKKKLFKMIPNLDFVIGPDQVDNIINILEEVKTAKSKVLSTSFDKNPEYQVQSLIRNPKVSSFINITKGCNNYCTFCVVPFTRGREKSRPLKDLVTDVKNLVKRGVKEISLLGQNVNSYQSSCGAGFSKLLQVIAEDTDIKRIRYTTSHPKDFDYQLACIMQKYRSKICDHVHLPVQSGNSDILKLMNRGYTREEYIEKANMIFETIPGVSFTTDIIVGFPTEEEKHIQDTYSLFHEVDFDAVFAYKYSPRPFTKAAIWEDQVSEIEKSTRLAKLFEVHKSLAIDSCKKYENKILEVLVEGVDEKNAIFRGRGTQNKMIKFTTNEAIAKGVESLVSKIVKVKVIEASPQSLKGVLVNG
ncbi:MAG: tRNA (N6-isopentenyl adenosine(37)-C2)-methylthiotransferase MiaB [Bdellovibrionaceae bacterium]|nr:tRNA (N6-isopentenyl adenosine(37)-C2)-methylthiotransferase MiaB [Pseudobdellovibrionaceae bacterium]